MNIVSKSFTWLWNFQNSFLLENNTGKKKECIYIIEIVITVNKSKN